MSIRLRLTLWYSGILALLLLVLGLSLHVVIMGQLVAEIDNSLRQRADEIARLVAQRSSFNAPETFKQVLEANPIDEFSSIPLFIKVLDTQGRTLVLSRNIRSERLSIETETLFSVLAGRPVLETIALGPSEQVRTYTRGLVWGGQLVGLVQVGESLRDVQSVAVTLRSVLMVQGLLSVAVAAAVGYLIARAGLAPINRVTELARRIEPQALSQRLGLRGRPVEVQRLADTFDAMLERLERAFEMQRRFVADASHELRTPLTSLQGNIDVLLMQHDLPEGTRATLERIASEVRRLVRLTANLLLLARADTRQEPDRRPVDLDVLLLEALHQAKGQTNGVQIRLGHEAQATVMGDSDRLRQAIHNLLDNALKYTPRGGLVEVSLFAEAPWARLVVSDTGVGIAPEELPHIFDRFYRSQRVRQTGGAGIGLSIVRWVVESHGGRIEVSSEVGKGSTFTILLPLAG